MTQMRYQVGLNDFRFTATLFVSNFTDPPAKVVTELGLQAKSVGEKGQPRLHHPTRKYEFNHVDFDIEHVGVDGNNVADFMQRLAEVLAPKANYLSELARQGARIECFVGVFIDRLCDQIFPCELLAELGRLKINLRLDVYGQEHPHREPD